MGVGGMGDRILPVRRSIVEHVHPVEEKRHGVLESDNEDHATSRRVQRHPDSSQEHDAEDNSSDEQGAEKEFEWLDSDVSAAQVTHDTPGDGEHHVLDVKV